MIYCMFFIIVILVLFLLLWLHQKEWFTNVNEDLSTFANKQFTWKNDFSIKPDRDPFRELESSYWTTRIGNLQPNTLSMRSPMDVFINADGTYNGGIFKYYLIFSLGKISTSSFPTINLMYQICYRDVFNKFQYYPSPLSFATMKLINVTANTVVQYELPSELSTVEFRSIKFIRLQIATATSSLTKRFLEFHSIQCIKKQFSSTTYVTPINTEYFFVLNTFPLSLCDTPTSTNFTNLTTIKNINHDLLLQCIDSTNNYVVQISNRNVQFGFYLNTITNKPSTWKYPVNARIYLSDATQSSDITYWKDYSCFDLVLVGEKMNYSIDLSLYISAKSQNTITIYIQLLTYNSVNLYLQLQDIHLRDSDGKYTFISPTLIQNRITSTLNVPNLYFNQCNSIIPTFRYNVSLPFYIHDTWTWTNSYTWSTVSLNLQYGFVLLGGFFFSSSSSQSNLVNYIFASNVPLELRFHKTSFQFTFNQQNFSFPVNLESNSRVFFMVQMIQSSLNFICYVNSSKYIYSATISSLPVKTFQEDMKYYSLGTITSIKFTSSTPVLWLQHTLHTNWSDLTYFLKPKDTITTSTPILVENSMICQSNARQQFGIFPRSPPQKEQFYKLPSPISYANYSVNTIICHSPFQLHSFMITHTLQYTQFPFPNKSRIQIINLWSFVSTATDIPILSVQLILQQGQYLSATIVLVHGTTSTILYESTLFSTKAQTFPRTISYQLIGLYNSFYFRCMNNSTSLKSGVFDVSYLNKPIGGILFNIDTGGNKMIKNNFDLSTTEFLVSSSLLSPNDFHILKDIFYNKTKVPTRTLDVSSLHTILQNPQSSILLK